MYCLLYNFTGIGFLSTFWVMTCVAEYFLTHCHIPAYHLDTIQVGGTSGSELDQQQSPGEKHFHL